MNKKIAIMLFVFINFCHTVLAQDVKIPQFYGLSYKQFVKSAQVNEPLDLQNIDYALLNAAVFFESNQQRIKHALPIFSYSKALEKASFEHSIDMVKRNFVNHVSKVKGKKTMSDRLEIVGITNVYAAENIALSFVLDMKVSDSYYTPSQNGGYFSLAYKGEAVSNMSYLKAARRIVKQWMDSPPHRKNLMGKNFKFLGCGVYLDLNKDPDNPPMFKATQLFSSQDANYEQYPAAIKYQ
jgi:uncharacterized protein YkwD